MYSDSLNLQSMDQALSLWQAAQKYILPHLVAKCIQYVKNKISPEYNIKVLEFIKLFEDETIKVSKVIFQLYFKILLSINLLGKMPFSASRAHA